MTLNADEIAALVAVLIALVTALVNYLNHLSNVKEIEVLHAKVDAVKESVQTTPPAVVLVDSHELPPAEKLVDGHQEKPIVPHG